MRPATWGAGGGVSLQAVDEAVEAAFPGMTQRSVRTGNDYGWALGRAAADLADLAVGERLCAGEPAEIRPTEAAAANAPPPLASGEQVA